MLIKVYGIFFALCTMILHHEKAALCVLARLSAKVDNIDFFVSLPTPDPDLLSRIDLDELMKKDEPPLNFPKTLEEFEYAFNERKSYHLYSICMDYSIPGGGLVCLALNIPPVASLPPPFFLLH
jgi:hypothetical protein